MTGRGWRLGSKRLSGEGCGRTTFGALCALARSCGDRKSKAATLVLTLSYLEHLGAGALEVAGLPGLVKGNGAGDGGVEGSNAPAHGQNH